MPKVTGESEGPLYTQGGKEKPLYESEVGAQISFSGTRLPRFIRVYLNFIWPISAPKKTGGATFFDWQTKKTLIQSICDEMTNPIKDREDKEILRGLFKILLSNFQESQLQSLKNIIHKNPDTATFLLQTSYHNFIPKVEQMLKRRAADV